MTLESNLWMYFQNTSICHEVPSINYNYHANEFLIIYLAILEKELSVQDESKSTEIFCQKESLFLYHTQSKMSGKAFH
jgi:hypothetical protein